MSIIPDGQEFADCQDCGQEMKKGGKCTTETIIMVLKRIPNNMEDRCHDCNVARGNFHHNGCDMERCPICKGQLISCDCEE